MKTIFILIDDISRSGGTERVASFLANQMSLAGYSVFLVSVSAENGVPYYPLDKRVELKVLKKQTLYELVMFLRKNFCDVMITISMGRLSFKVACLHKLLRLGCRLILSEHVAFEMSTKLVRIFKWLSYQFADDLVLLTQHDYKLLNKIVRSRVSIIPNASNFELQHESTLEHKNKIVLAVGRLTYQKAFDRLLRIWASLDDRDGWVLHIVGDGEKRNELQNLIFELDISESVSLISATPFIADEYKNASILAMTSRYEGLPLVLIEAKSYGLPAIAFDCKTGPREIINDNEDGILVADGDETAFSLLLTTLIRDDSLRKRMQHEALKNAEHYTVEKISQQWQELIS
ncbi:MULTISPECIES: glycosyltransferase family 4 protein [Citrobacter]|uniref:glycosyltransferase family 4 protein n=1 Tax=Citrobacter TaxID=544 RepID=UPI001BCCDBC7|nr:MULTISPECIES: glycosyltransferase family 4 protein [Citrobacter]MBJ8799141.1 glycosyltransferase family 4 protein [Citrobacter freundii]MCS0534318.1 glycosyltransferase family 4 protein [Citrobacter portucalensis]MCX9066865.1 glycosyltransferase family 4 protein [Citrobacter portucalensis]MDM2887980.1 glycosyltransferase family 4 protein [Citrobacter sp. Cpo045]MDM2915302.1 glycosyltransferase family 4 protein [Citrobacter sp. Cpo035]